MEILFASKYAPSASETFLCSETYAKVTNMTNYGIIEMISNQLSRRVITIYTLEVAKIYYLRFCERLKICSGHTVKELFIDDALDFISLMCINIALKITEDEPVIYYLEIVGYKKIKYFNSTIPTVKEFNQLECEILQLIEFNLSL